MPIWLKGNEVSLEKKIIEKVVTSLRFRTQPLASLYKAAIVGPTRRKHGALSRRLEYPFFFLSPQKKKEIFVSRPSALGDVLLCTPALREFKQQNPNIKIHFFTHYEDLVRGLPYIDSVSPYDQRPWDSIEFSYENSIPPIRHIAKIFGDQLNINVANTVPDCIVPQKETDEIYSKFAALPRPWFVVSRKAGPWTPNKDWPDSHWDELVSRLLKLGSVFEVGNSSMLTELAGFNYVNLTGCTNVLEMVALIAMSNIYLGPISGPVHIASATKVPSVVIYGGYELASCSGYPMNINLTNELNCAPCWLRTPCPIDKKCLSEISSDRVFDAVLTILGRKKTDLPVNSWAFSYAPT